MTESRFLIETLLPLRALSEEARREKAIRHGHISTLHVWWARRPLVVARAAVLGALLTEEAGVDENFIARLCRWEVHDGDPAGRYLLEQARALIRQRFGETPPRVLDSFAGGGSIPLEALRLGAEACAVEYNPVAYLILKATLEYPQRYGHRLVSEVQRWGHWVLEQARRELEEFYLTPPPAPSPLLTEGQERGGDAAAGGGGGVRASPPLPLGEGPGVRARPPLPLGEGPGVRATPIAYIWSRTLRCPNPACGAEIPLFRQFWLARKADKRVALKPIPNPAAKRVDFAVVEGRAVDFDPSQGTVSRGHAVCLVCGASVQDDYVKAEAQAGRMGHRLVAVVTTRGRGQGREYRLATEEDQAAFRRAEGRPAGPAANPLPLALRPPLGARGAKSRPVGVKQHRKAYGLATASNMPVGRTLQPPPVAGAGDLRQMGAGRARGNPPPDLRPRLRQSRGHVSGAGNWQYGIKPYSCYAVRLG
jgi:putative DNA methylase